MDTSSRRGDDALGIRGSQPGPGARAGTTSQRNGIAGYRGTGGSHSSAAG